MDAFSRAAARLATLRMLGSAQHGRHRDRRRGSSACGFQHGRPHWDRLPGAAIIRGVGGAARQVDAGGVRWGVAGAPTAVAEVCAALTDAG